MNILFSEELLNESEIIVRNPETHMNLTVLLTCYNFLLLILLVKS